MEGRGKDDSESFSLVHRLLPSQVTLGVPDVSVLLLKITSNLHQPLQTSIFHWVSELPSPPLLRLAGDTSSCHIQHHFSCLLSFFDSSSCFY